jgi:ribosomal protein L12E/L44/L45/RPP1/RPP2
MDEVLQQLLDDFKAKNAAAKSAGDANTAAQAAAVNAKSASEEATKEKESSRAALIQAIQGA